MKKEEKINKKTKDKEVEKEEIVDNETENEEKENEEIKDKKTKNKETENKEIENKEIENIEKNNKKKKNKKIEKKNKKTEEKNKNENKKSENEKIEIDFLEEKIKESKKIKIDKESIRKIAINLSLAIFCVIYFLIINIAYNSLSIETFEKVTHIFSGIFVLVGIIFLEKLYKEESGKKAITAIEFFTLGIHSISLIYVMSKYKIELKEYLIGSSYIFSIYYIIKTIIIYFKARKKYLSSLSDVKEIVKKEKPIKKEAKKRRKKKINKNKVDEK